MDSTEINFDRVVEILRTTHSVTAYVEQTGGGTATIYAGPTREEEDWGTRYAAVAGPGWFAGPGWTEGRGIAEDFYIGPDDEGYEMPVVAGEVGAYTEDKIAALIAAQARKDDPTTPLSADDVAAVLA